MGCCELLSFLSIFGIQHNSLFIRLYAAPVVNCFHFWVSLGYNTTFLAPGYKVLMLWIAFIFEYLWDTTQQSTLMVICFIGCELLSFLSIFGIQHNHELSDFADYTVVNCFHFWVSLGYNTTSCKIICNSWPLWIAFIFEYLWDTTQHKNRIENLINSCELLSFLSIFGIQHNWNWMILCIP